MYDRNTQDLRVDRRLEQVQEMVRACMQCGTCTASCPNEFAMDATPRKMWRMVLMGRLKELFQSRTFSLCSSCYTCSLRCPRGLPLTEAMTLLKQVAVDYNPHFYKKDIAFHHQFLQSVRRHGRVREMEFMTLYFAALKNPFLPMKYASLGLRLMSKGKVSLQLPSLGAGKLKPLFQKVEALDRKTDDQEQESA